MTSTDSMLYAAKSDITIERVRALVGQTGPESPMIEYKETWAKSIARGVAALANTYGGLVLVGVTDDRRVTGVEEDVIKRVADHCSTKIEPPWVPEIIPVPLDENSDRFVLVLRVPPDHPYRPLLVEGVAYVRHQNTTYPADWQRLRDLFVETGAPNGSDNAWTIRSPDLPVGVDGIQDETVDFIIRSGLEIPVSRDAKWRPLDERTVGRLIGALNQSPLDSALWGLVLGDLSSGDGQRFQRSGPNNGSRTVSLETWRAPAGWPHATIKPVTGKVEITVPGGYGDFARSLRIQADIVVRWSAAAENPPPWWQISPDRLGGLIDATVSTLSDQEVTDSLAELAGIDVLAVPQPRIVHFRTARAVSDVLATTGLRQIPGAGGARGAHLLADPSCDLSNVVERQRQVKSWLIQIAMDAGLEGMTQLLEG